jgi:ABC-type transport system involved in multi-copper enzyme maturation permease subunit
MGSSTREYARLGESYFYALIGVELALVMLVAPAATAGAISVDRARGTLEHILATDLSDPEIVLGKLAARLLPVFGLVGCTWPVMALCSLLGGIDPTALTLAFAVIVAVAVLGCSMALALSVWARKANEVILASYTFWVVLLTAWPIWFALPKNAIVAGLSHWLLLADPFYLSFAPYVAPKRFDSWDYVCFFATALIASGVLVLLAVWRMRAVACRAIAAARLDLVARMGRWLPGPSLERNPVLWREWHRSRPSSWMTILVVLLGGSTSVACVIGAVSVWRYGTFAFGPPGPAQMAGIMGYVLQVILGLLMLSALAPMSMSEERQRGSLDVLAVTPLSTAAIVLGKWWGTFRLVPVLAIGSGLMAFALATARRITPTRPPGFAGWGLEIGLGYRLCGAFLLVATILAHGALITSIGLALGTWIKRQSRAIAVSVCAFVCIAVAWPFLVAAISGGPAFYRFASLSPIFVAVELSEQLTLRFDRLRELLWWIGFWNVGVAAWAVGLLWLTWRTFDHGLGRIPVRPRTTPLLADVFVLFAGTAAAACSYIAISIWANGVVSHSLNRDEGGLVALFVALVALGLLGLAVVAPLGMHKEWQSGSSDVLFAGPSSTRGLVMAVWWRRFRLLLLLALGPGLIALAAATARRVPPPYFTAQMTVPPGTVVTNAAAPPVDRAPTKPAPWEPSLGDRLCSAALLVLTILAHGAATISLALSVAARFEQRGRVIAASVSMYVLAAAVWPFYVYLVLYGASPAPGMASLSPIWAVGFLAANLVTREPQFPGIVWWAAFWYVLVSLFAIGLLWRTPGMRNALTARRRLTVSLVSLSQRGLH